MQQRMNISESKRKEKKTMKKEYKAPVVEVSEFAVEDVITTSSTGGGKDNWETEEF